MRTDSVTAKTLLGIFLLSAQLCPCPAPAADVDESHTETAHHGAHAAQEIEPAEDCHGESSRDDCGMPDTVDVDGIATKVDPIGDSPDAAFGASASVIDHKSSHRILTPVDLHTKQLRPATPVALSDRMLD